MTTPKPDIPTTVTPTSASNLSLEDQDFYKEPEFNTVAPMDPTNGVVPSPTAETAKLGIKPEPKVDVAAAPVAATTNGKAQETPITPKAESVITTALTPASAVPTSPTTITPATTTVATTTVDPTAVPAVTAAIAAAVHSTDDVDMTFAPGTPIEELSLVVEESIQDDSDPDEDFSEDELRENGAASEEARQSRQARDKIEGLEMRNSILANNLEEVLLEKQRIEGEFGRSVGFSQDLHRQLVETQQKLVKRERDYEVMSKNYLEHVRLIRATDDDHSTIIDRLTQLKASIEHLVRKAQGSRSVNLDKEAVIEHFKNSGLLEGFPIAADKLEAFHLNLYMESVIMSTLVTRFFGKALSCIFSFNEGFKDIYDWMHSRNEKLAVRWRQQLCVMITQDPATKLRQEEEVTAAATELSELMSKVYTNANELAKLKDLCNKAFELSVAMTAFESVISPETVALGTAFDEENMGTSLKSNPEGKVALVIFPSFVDKERAFNIRSKVWCY
ncbi:hypothetical protein BGZ96_004083 [Linnemannia gamsii]|uniref:Uncharacterized protein n=1 Tax=Linnemannia gamsii TaxID=64522 RepID=A0ABQ7JII2_9FUNG|nr:hypothetical protein BGZ96_004083 [Linnemannia gamsii]